MHYKIFVAVVMLLSLANVSFAEERVYTEEEWPTVRGSYKDPRSRKMPNLVCGLRFEHYVNEVDLAFLGELVEKKINLEKKVFEFKFKTKKVWKGKDEPFIVVEGAPLSDECSKKDFNIGDKKLIAVFLDENGIPFFHCSCGLIHYAESVYESDRNLELLDKKIKDYILKIENKKLKKKSNKKLKK